MVEKKVLIVDNEETVLKVLEQLFRSAGYKPFCAVDGNAAIRLMEEHHIRVIFTDLRMPGMDGMVLCRRAKQRDADAIVYAISAYISAYSPEQFVKRGFAGQFTKPFDTKAILDACENAFAELSPREESLPPSQPDRKQITRSVVLDERMLASIVGSRKDVKLVGKTLTCVNSTVSRSAIQLRADQKIEPGTDLLLHVGVTGQPKPCLLLGIVRWCGPSEGGEAKQTGCSIGVEILDASRDFDSWCEFLRELDAKRRVSN